MKTFLLSSVFVAVLSLSSIVVGDVASNNPQCAGTWCTVNNVLGTETFCCKQGTSCPNPDGLSFECVDDS